VASLFFNESSRSKVEIPVSLIRSFAIVVILTDNDKFDAFIKSILVLVHKVQLFMLF
jgi:hypothetical protein